jgi:hypothetical protein
MERETRRSATRVAELLEMLKMEERRRARRQARMAATEEWRAPE